VASLRTKSAREGTTEVLLHSIYMKPSRDNERPRRSRVFVMSDWAALLAVGVVLGGGWAAFT